MNEGLPTNAVHKLSRVLLPLQVTHGAVKVVVQCNSSECSVRDLAAYLELGDHIYGRLSPGGLQSYSQRESGHLGIAEVRHGSFEFLREAHDAAGSPERLLILWLFLKYLPAVDTLASACNNNYSQASLMRARRKRIRREMEADLKLRRLDKRHRDQLIGLVDVLLLREKALLKCSSRFTHQSVVEVTIHQTDDTPKKLTNLNG